MEKSAIVDNFKIENAFRKDEEETKMKTEVNDESKKVPPTPVKPTPETKSKIKKRSNNSSKKNSTKTENEESPTKKKKKKDEKTEVWKWWEEEKDKKKGGTKWTTLIHGGPLFPPAYEPLPKTVNFKYNGSNMALNPEAEEVATFYARLLDHEYTTKDIFNRNFFIDWRKTMTSEEREIIKDLDKCDFSQLRNYFVSETEKRKAMTKEEKLKMKEEREKEQKEYGIALIDGHEQAIANFRIEPPGIFRGRGKHPKIGCLKRRIQPENVIINCSKDSIPPPPPGHQWREIRHDNSVAWLCSWRENVLGQNKYILLSQSSKLKGEKDLEKFEKARSLGKIIDQIRQKYFDEMKSKEMKIRQRAVAIYFIDKFALRAGNEKDTNETADTVGCCSLRCEHIKLYKEFEGQMFVVEFDFLGKDSIRYFNRLSVDKKVFKNLKKFMQGKNGSDELFDRLTTSSLNQHLKSLMPGLTAKCFRTYNASFTLQQQLEKLTNANDSIHEKILSYNRANREVAILCNHQESVSKTHEKSMQNLKKKIKEKKKELKTAKKELEKIKAEKNKDKLDKMIKKLKDVLKKLKADKTNKDENKQIALSTSKLNYLDPRISVAWCQKFNVPIEKIFNKTQREKFQWAIDMTQKCNGYVF